MNLFQYLDDRYRSLSLELQKEYSIAKEGELKAAYALIQWQRSFFKWLHIPFHCLKFWLIKAGLQKPSATLCPKVESTTIESAEGTSTVQTH